MSKPLTISDPPRAIPPGVHAELPLATLAWRSACKASEQELRRGQALAARTREECAGLEAIADEAHRLNQFARETTDAGTARMLASCVERLVGGLRRAGLDLVAPAGAPYRAELREWLDNVAQVPGPGLGEPMVAAVIEPALLHRGALLRMGKAVIAVPAATETSNSAQ